MVKIDLRTLLRARNMKMSQLAAAMNVEKSTVLRWATIRIPAERVMQIEKHTNIPRWMLRPDLYPPATEKKVRGSK